MSHTFATVRSKAKVAADVHMHSLRHFHATVLDPVISEAQKQTRLGWSTVKMARHYTDSVPEEDRRPQLTWESCCPQAKPAWLRSRAETPSTYSDGTWSAGVPPARSPAVRSAVSPLNAGNADPSTDPEDWEGKRSLLDGPIERGAGLPQQIGGLLDAQKGFGSLGWWAGSHGQSPVVLSARRYAVVAVHPPNRHHPQRHPGPPDTFRAEG